MFSNWMCFTENASGNIFKLEVVLLTETPCDWAEWKQRKYHSSWPQSDLPSQLIQLGGDWSPSSSLSLYSSLHSWISFSSAASLLVLLSSSSFILLLCLGFREQDSQCAMHELVSTMIIFVFPSLLPSSELDGDFVYFCFSLTSLSCFSITCGCKGG